MQYSNLVMLVMHFFLKLKPKPKQTTITTSLKLYSSSTPTHQYNKKCNLSTPQLLNTSISTHPTTSTSFHWNNLIKNTTPITALHLFDEMRQLGWTPDDYTYPYILKACGSIPSLPLGASVHALVLITGFLNSNVFVANSAVTMYGKCGARGEARRVFDEMIERWVFDRISWNSIIAVYAQGGEYGRALRLFETMVKISMCPDAISLVNVLPGYGNFKLWRRGREIHCYAVRRGLIGDVYVGNAIVDCYAKCELLDEAKNVFEGMVVKDVVSWNVLVTGYSQVGRFEDALGLFERMREGRIELNVVTWSAVIAGYAQRGLGSEALHVFRDMIGSGAGPNAVTLVSVLSGCAAVAALGLGKEIQCYMIKRFLNLHGNDSGDEMMVINGLIDMYAKCKSFKIARRIFDGIESKNKNVVTWTVMIGGYAQHGEANDALILFSEMLNGQSGMMPNGFTISCALVACARLGGLRHGREVHAYAIRNRYEEAMLFVSNCLIDMYAKSGDVGTARVVFDNMSHKNAVSWTSLMTGYGMHGYGEETLHVFDGMIKAGLPVDGVTFVVVLYACSHSGMIEKGIDYFNNMKKDFGVIPEAEHYACMVDLYGRAGRLDEAMKAINEMPMEPSSVVWLALLSACRLHGNVETGELAVSKLLELKFENDGVYTLLSNIYASAKRWKEVARIRSLMKHSGIQKRPGCSWVQGKKGTTTFFVGDKSHPLTETIYDLLDDLIHRIKILGYIPETSFALHDVDEEEKGDLLFEHSEKLALAYGILTTAPGLPIRITKNLRVCGDCHKAFTYISRIIEHEIIVRDTSRFHHFKNGSCSCKGYW